MTEHPTPGGSRIWHVPCSFNLVNGCRVRAEALARRLWPLGTPQTAVAAFGSLDVVKTASGGLNGGAICYDCPEDEDVEDYRPIVKRQNNTHSSGWENPVAMLGVSEEDEFYDPEAGSSPPSPAVDEIVVNPPIPLPMLCRGTLRPEDDASGSRFETTVNEQPRKQQMGGFRRADAVDINGLYEKLQRYADSRSFSDAESDTYYDVESGIGSPDDDDRSRCDSVDGDSGYHHHNHFDSLRSVQDSSKLDGDLDNGYCDFNGRTFLPQHSSDAKVQVRVPNGEINMLADFLYGECKVSSVSPQLSSSPQQSHNDSVVSDFVEVTDDKDVPKLVSASTSSSLTNFVPNQVIENAASSSETHEKPEINDFQVHKDSQEVKVPIPVEDYPPMLSSPRPEMLYQEKIPATGNIANGVSGISFMSESSQDFSSTLSPKREDTDILGSSPKNHSFLIADDESDGSRSPVQRTFLRSTSLKTGKTPPGTPHRKKIVRFADALGLDLELVRTIASDDVPTVPASAYTDLKLPDNERPRENETSSKGGSGGTASDIRRNSGATTTIHPVWQSSLQGLPQYQQNRRTLTPEFSQPVADYNFLDRVRSQGVCLENVVVTDLSVSGVVRVLNINFEKSVLVRYTVNEWTTSDETVGRYVPSSCDGFSDKFAFSLNVPFLSHGQRLIFAIRFVTNGREYWDNNFGKNYVLRCTSDSPQYLLSPSDGPIWLHHFI